MTKTAAILAGTAILIGGCHVSPRSITWHRVTATPHPAPEAGEADRVFAADLHHNLMESHTPHKVVTAEFTYHGDYARDGVAHRTMVVYRDDGRKGQNWWLMDERLTVPFWLPNEPLDRQISFYLARPVTLVNVSDFSNADRAKMILPPDHKPARLSGTSTIQRAEAHPEAAKAPKSTPARTPAKTKKPAGETKIVPAPAAKPVVKAPPKAEAKPPAAPVEKHDPKPASVPPKAEAKSSPKAGMKPAARPPEKAPANLIARPSMGTPGKPAEHAPKSALTSTEPPPKKKSGDEAPKETADSAKAATKSEEKSPAKGAAKPVATGKPSSQPDLFGNGESADPTKAAKPEEKKPAKPAVKAAPSGKPVKHPDLFNRSEDGTPQATIIDDGAAKPKKDEAKPEASATKPNFFKRFFRRIFARHRAQD